MDFAKLPYFSVAIFLNFFHPRFLLGVLLQSESPYMLSELEEVQSVYPCL